MLLSLQIFFAVASGISTSTGVNTWLEFSGNFVEITDRDIPEVLGKVAVKTLSNLMDMPDLVNDRNTNIIVDYHDYYLLLFKI
jgi:hypothetical protein